MVRIRYIHRNGGSLTRSWLAGHRLMDESTLEMSSSFSLNCRSSFGKCWYVVNTKPNHERQVEKNLRRIGLECFLPLLQEEKTIRRQTKTVISPLFPGYVFVRVNIVEHYRTVVYARGVRKIVEFDSTPVEVDTAIIDAIKLRVMDRESGSLRISKEIGSGEVVRIKSGLLAGLDAVFVQEMSGHQRAMVLLSTLTLRARVVVHVDQIASCVAA